MWLYGDCDDNDDNDENENCIIPINLFDDSWLCLRFHIITQSIQIINLDYGWDLATIWGLEQHDDYFLGIRESLRALILYMGLEATTQGLCWEFLTCFKMWCPFSGIKGKSFHYRDLNHHLCKLILQLNPLTLYYLCIIGNVWV